MSHLDRGGDDEDTEVVAITSDGRGSGGPDGDERRRDRPRPARRRMWQRLAAADDQRDRAVHLRRDESVQAQRDADPDWRTTTYAALFDYDQIKGGDGFLCVKSTGSTPGQDKQYCGRYGYDPCFSYNVTNINDNPAKGQLSA